MLTSGVPILQAMETTAGTVDNVLIQDAILAARAAIREGDTIADPLAASRQFPPMVVQMITIGEETGQLDSMLEKVAIFYESEVDAALEGLTSAIEPVMIVGLGGVVLFILIALWMPLIGVIQNLSQ
jgi:type IV pilus assembly protein PilC